MDPTHRPSPASLSPYQQAIKACTMAQPSTYPSPARSDPDTSKYPTDNLGIYNYSLSLATSGPAQIFPPSPQPTESWAQLTTGTSPLMTEAPVETWPSMYEPPISRASPLPWNSGLPFPHSRFMENRNSPMIAHTSVSHRSSQSSSRAMSVYARDDTEHTYPPVKLEGSAEWTTDDEPSPGHSLPEPPLTVSPERLSTGIFPYSVAYSAPPMPKYETAADSCFSNKGYQGLSYDARRRDSGRRDMAATAPTHRTRIRRNPTTPENANFTCDVCGKLFQRSYNHKTHMEIHDPRREFPNPCTYPNCNKKFVRRTDLMRHEKSVHVKAKDFKCGACEARFARKDTLRRHEEDGCSKRNELKDGRLPPRSNPLKSGGGPSPLGYRPHLAEPVYPSRSPSLHAPGLYREDGFGGHHGGY